MADCTAAIKLSDGSDKPDLSVVLDNANVELGTGRDDFADGVMGWQWAETNNEATIAEAGGVLSMSIAANVGTGVLNGWNTNSFLSGDFDVQVDFSNYVGSNGTALHTAQLRAISGSIRLGISRQKSSSTDIFNGVTQNPGFANNTIATTTAIGKFRIARRGELAECYYDANDGNGWQLLHSLQGFSTIDLQIQIFILADTTAHTNQVGIDFDNFTPVINAIYDTSNPSPNVSPWNGFLIGAQVKMDTLAIIEGPEGSLLYQFATNNGPLNGVNLTFAQLANAANNFTVTDAVNSLRIVVIFVSDGTQKALVGIDASVTYSITIDYPSEDDVRNGVDYDDGNLTGNYVPAEASKYKQGEKYGSNGIEFTGTFVPTCDYPDESDVLEGVDYDSGNLTGTLVPFKASYELPQEVLLEDEEILIFEGCDS